MSYATYPKKYRTFSFPLYFASISHFICHMSHTDWSMPRYSKIERFLSNFIFCMIFSFFSQFQKPIILFVTKIQNKQSKRSKSMKSKCFTFLFIISVNLKEMKMNIEKKFMKKFIRRWAQCLCVRVCVRFILLLLVDFVFNCAVDAPVINCWIFD